MPRSDPSAGAGAGSDEQTLLRDLFDNHLPGEIPIANAYYAMYFLRCGLVRRELDGVFELRPVNVPREAPAAMAGW
jgi:hypothetical protein